MKTQDNLQLLNKKRKKMHPIAIVMLIILIIYTASLLFIYIWGFFTSVKKIPAGFLKDMVGLPEGLPTQWAWENYKKAYEAFVADFEYNGVTYTAVFIDMFKNSMIYSLSAVIGLTTTWCMAYVCSQFKGRLSNFIYRLNIVLMLIPIVGTLPSQLQIYTKVGIYNTWWHVVVNGLSFIGADFLIFHAYLNTVGSEIREAALIDGAGNFSTMIKVVFPLTINMFLILFTARFIAHWNDYMTMIVYLPSYPNLAYGVYKFSSTSETGASWPPVKAAGAMILMAPILLLFIIFRNKIMGEITIGTSK